MNPLINALCVIIIGLILLAAGFIGSLGPTE